MIKNDGKIIVDSFWKKIDEKNKFYSEKESFEFFKKYRILPSVCIKHTFKGFGLTLYNGLFSFEQYLKMYFENIEEIIKLCQTNDEISLKPKICSNIS